jgi:hypothetical protein
LGRNGALLDRVAGGCNRTVYTCTLFLIARGEGATNR